ncbi:MAG TPA: ABC transporter permease [Candidatus Solibacter sp.]|nr:ABC transporter permease [Candidatus Solibacter sp.]
MRQLLNWFRRRDLERGLDRELQYHLERRIADLMREGVPEGEARRRAVLEIGGVTQVREEVRDVWLTRWLRDFLYDLRFSARGFLQSPSFTAIAVLSLALGIGATAAIYSLVDQVILHALPVREPERLALIDWEGDPVATAFGSWNLMSYPICRDLQQQDRFFEGVFCRAATLLNLSTGGDTEPAAAEIVSGTYFPVLGVGAALGRVIGIEDDRPPISSAVVVISYDFWKTRFGGDPDIIGRKLFVNRNPMTIVGVAAAGFRGIDVGEVPVLWIPTSASSLALPGFSDLLDRRKRWTQVLGRLRPGVSTAQAQAGVQPWFRAMLEEDTRRPGFPPVTAERRRRYFASILQVTPASQGHSPLRRQWSQPLWVLLAGTGVLLGLACLNVAGLFLARGSARVREISTRLALGASPSRIGRQLLADSVLLAVTGGLLGVGLAPLALQALIAFLPSDTVANALKAGIDSRLLGFGFLLSVCAGLLSGLAPALHAGRKSLIDSLRERGGGAFGGVRLRKIIVALQIAFSLILVIGAVLFVRSLTTLLDKGPGFNTTNLISFGLDPRRNGYSTPQASRLMHRIYDELRTSPAIAASSMLRNQLLIGGSWKNHMTVDAGERVATVRVVHMNAVTPGFFDLMGIRMVAGRDFNDRDASPIGENTDRVAIVNQAFVRRYLAGRNPLGARICSGAGPDAKPNIEIVGVVANFSYHDMREESEQAYFPIFDSHDSGSSFYVRARGTSEQVLQSIRAIVRKADPSLPITYFRTVNEQVSRSLNSERLLATISTAFGVFAVVLSLVGLYGVIAYVVTQRTRELGIRIALGATRGSTIWLVLRDAVAMIAAGAAIALPAAAALGRLVESQLFGVKASDPITLGEATLLLVSAALVAALIPAWRASSVNPTDALRLE